MSGSRPNVARAFTITEMLLTLVAVALLLGLLVFSVRGTLLIARSGADTQTMSGLVQASERFREEYGFAPPLMRKRNLADARDFVADPTGSGAFRVNVWGGDDEAVLRRIGPPAPVGSPSGVNAESPLDDARYSVYSLPVYLMGVGAGNASRATGLGTPGVTDPIDGVGSSGDGAYFTPFSDGGFEIPSRVASGEASLRGARPALVGTGRGMQLREDGADRRDAVFTDRQGTPIRYYQWLNGVAVPNGRARLETLGDYRVPLMVGRLGTAASGPLGVAWSFDQPVAEKDIELNARLRAPALTLAQAGFAVVGAGPDKFFGDETDAEMEAVLGPRFAERRREARLEAERDNIILLGQ